mgnify:CR=1 FL=1
MKPTITEENYGTTIEHPAIGCIEFSRPLNSSDVSIVGEYGKFNNFVEVTISTGSLRTTGSNTVDAGRACPDKTLVKLRLSEQQLFEALTNRRSAATLLFSDGQRQPEFDNATIEEDIAAFKNNLKEARDKVDGYATEITELLSDTRLPKGKQKEIESLLRSIRGQVTANQDYAVEQAMMAVHKAEKRAQAHRE